MILGWEDPLEEGMASHSSILAWRIPLDRGAWRDTLHIWSQRVGLDWSDLHTHIHTQTHTHRAILYMNAVGNDNSLQYSCLENSMDRGAWQATVQGDCKEF